MFCRSCGKEIAVGAKFCPNCGKAVENNVQPSFTSNTHEKKSSVLKNTETSFDYGFRKLLKNKKILLILAAVLVVVIVIAANAGGGYKKPFQRLFKAVETQNTRYMYDVYTDYWQYSYASGVGESYVDERLRDEIEDWIDIFDCGDRLHISFRITNIEKATKAQLREIQEDIWDEYDVPKFYSYDEGKMMRSITDACIAHVNIRVRGNEDSGIFDYSFLLLKEKGSWKFTKGWISNSFWD